MIYYHINEWYQERKNIIDYNKKMEAWKKSQQMTEIKNVVEKETKNIDDIAVIV